MLILMAIEDMLADLGCTSIKAAASIDKALALIDAEQFDLAILDVNLNGQTIAPVADALAARGTPFVFATGYGERGLPEAYRDRPTLKKPFQMDGLSRTIESALTAKI